MGLQGWINEFARSGAGKPIPTTYHVPIEPELSRMLLVFAAAQNIKPETVIAEALRAYLGADQ